MYAVFEKMLESCQGPLMGDQITIERVKSEGVRGRYSFVMGGALLENNPVEVSINWIPETGTFMLAVPFILEGYAPEKRSLFLEMINEINAKSDHVCTSILMMSDSGIRGITRASFVLHRDYVSEETWQYTRDFIRTNTLALMVEMSTACVMVGGPDGIEGTA